MRIPRSSIGTKLLLALLLVIPASAEMAAPVIATSTPMGRLVPVEEGARADGEGLAIASYEAALLRRPDFGQARFNLAATQRRLGRRPFLPG